MQMKSPDASTLAIRFCKAIEESGWKGNTKELNQLRYTLAGQHLGKPVRSFLLLSDIELAKLQTFIEDPSSITRALRAPPDSSSKGLFDAQGFAAYQSPEARIPVARPKTLRYRRVTDLSWIGVALSERIIRELGGGDEEVALEKIERDPYCLIAVEGIGFKTADTIALEDYSFSPDDPRRHRVGNTELLADAGGCLAMERYREVRANWHLRDERFLTLGTVVEGRHVWLPEELRAEKLLARFIARYAPLRAPVTPASTEAQEIITEALLNAEQEAAVHAVLSGQRVTTVTGGAGVGKSHTIATITRCVRLRQRTVLVCAFSGKAADRCREALVEGDALGPGVDTGTIHRALKHNGREFTLDELPHDLVIIDEMSMVHSRLLAAVVERLKPSAQLVLVGDDGQLPPIGYGTPFVDTIEAGAARVHLIKNYRQAGQLEILNFAEGLRNAALEIPQTGTGVFVHASQDESEVLGALNAVLTDLQETGDVLSWQAITYTNLNRELFNVQFQEIYNPRGAFLFSVRNWKTPGRSEIRAGDKVVVVKNDYDVGVFNGQTGVAIGVVEAQELSDTRGRPVKVVQVEIEGSVVEIPLELASRLLQLGYVITTHKAQGSGWDTVIIIEPSKVRSESARRWYYTAVTRAKTSLYIFSFLSLGSWWRNATANPPNVQSTLARRIESEPRPVLTSDPVSDAEALRVLA